MWYCSLRQSWKFHAWNHLLRISKNSNHGWVVSLSIVPCMHGCIWGFPEHCRTISQTREKKIKKCAKGKKPRHNSTF
jgi:hypothetical protein